MTTGHRAKSGLSRKAGGGGVTTTWTPENIAKANSLQQAGNTYAQIAHAMGLTRNQVATHFHLQRKRPAPPPVPTVSNETRAEALAFATFPRELKERIRAARAVVRGDKADVI